MSEILFKLFRRRLILLTLFPPTCQYPSNTSQIQRCVALTPNCTCKKDCNCSLICILIIRKLRVKKNAQVNIIIYALLSLQSLDYS